MKFALVLAATALLLTSAISAEKERGWYIQFVSDSFDKKVAPQAINTERGARFDAAYLGLGCNQVNKLVAFFYKSTPILGQQMYRVEFRTEIGDGTFEFRPKTFPILGKNMGLNSAKSDEFLKLLGSGSGNIRYRLGSSTGEFSEIGTQETITYMRSFCASQ